MAKCWANARKCCFVMVILIGDFMLLICQAAWQSQEIFSSIFFGSGRRFLHRLSAACLLRRLRSGCCALLRPPLRPIFRRKSLTATGVVAIEIPRCYALKSCQLIVRVVYLFCPDGFVETGVFQIRCA